MSINSNILLDKVLGLPLHKQVARQCWQRLIGIMNVNLRWDVDRPVKDSIVKPVVGIVKEMVL